MLNQSQTINNNHNNNFRKSNNLSSVSSKEKPEKFSFEQFLEKVGTQDWYQIRSFVCFCIQWFVIGWFIASQSFLFQKPQLIEYNVKEKDLCIVLKNNISDILKPNQFKSISMEFSLYCDQDYLRNIFVFLGPLTAIFSYIIFGYLSDNYGRKHGLKLAWKIFTFGTIILYLTKVLFLVISGYIITSFGAYSILIIQLSLINEQSTGKVRVLSQVGLNIGFSLGQLIFSFFPFVIEEWRQLVFISAVIPAILLNILIEQCKESPRYYYTKSKIKALRMLNYIASINEKQLLNIDLERSVWSEEAKYRQFVYQDIFRFQSIRVSLFGGLIIFFCGEMMYKASEITIHRIDKQNIYLQLFYLTLADLIAGIFTLFFINLYKRKIQLQITCILSVLFIITSQIFSNLYQINIDNDQTFPIIFSMILIQLSRLFVSYFRNVTFVYFAELFPTVVRSMTLGMIFSFAQLGLIMIQFMSITQMNDFVLIVPIVFLNIVALFHFQWLPETNVENQYIKDEIQEISFGQDDDFFLEEDDQNIQNKYVKYD
ncbi:major facilitator superfamily protein, putative [Ichthyophthirius multifiliis]|uniref:Major facilitator superfamily protein, putative n=1 Tax=Ichthyophthirius multifiliis TaxID=5932 RepID=G0QXA1_ICHMU|nr:major facilitator superfamily protein, putative [Ichthyophthirius multifiliis]EGR30153.1 major facilitator superfamily protein, putative [Ichthyophthirius multifiliis]|eukprot:XP_004031389.1 major facilitator superfamily protein, putative [Ichthyophthirius multifiliis]